MKAKEVRERIAALMAKARAVIDRADTEERDLTDEDRQQIERIHAEADPLVKTREVLEQDERITASMLQIPECTNGAGGTPGDVGDLLTAGTDGAVSLTEEARAMAMAAWALSGSNKTSRFITQGHRDAMRLCGLTADAGDLELRLPTFHSDPFDGLNGRLATIKNALSVAAPAGGGYTVPEGFVRALEIALAQFGGMRNVATIMRTSTGEPLPYPTSNDTTNEGELIQENVAADTDGQDVAFGSIVFQAYEYSSKFVRVSNQLLRDSAFNIPSLLGRMLGERIGRITNTHFTTGDGASKPYGVVPRATVGKTAASASAIAADEILEFIHSVDPAYRAAGKFMMHDNIFLQVSLLKDGEGNYLLTPGLTDKSVYTLRGYPLQINQAMQSSIATGTDVMLFGDFAKYVIREVANFKLQRAVERFIEYNQVAFIGFQSCDGNLVDAGTNPVKSYRMA